MCSRDAHFKWDKSGARLESPLTSSEFGQHFAQLYDVTAHQMCLDAESESRHNSCLSLCLVVVFCSLSQVSSRLFLSICIVCFWSLVSKSVFFLL